MDTRSFSTWLEIDLGAIKNNVSQLANISGRPVMAVVKANAYGHGMLAVARALEGSGTEWLGVARVEEALSLRQAGIQAQILVLGYTPPAQAAEAAAQDIQLAVYDREVTQACVSECRAAGQPLRVHVKIDTGMGRLGLLPGEGLDFLHWLKTQPGIVVEGLFTHFARADEPERDETRLQLGHFQDLLSSVEAAGLRPPWVHAANSAATLNFPGAHFDLVRCGIAIYGLAPDNQVDGLPDTFRPALTWKTRLVSVKTLPSGSGIGYGHRYVTRAAERVGVIAAGYADGFRRRLGNFALVGGQRAPVVGGVCMDQSMVALDGIPEARVGDEVVLIGLQGSSRITAEEIGAEWGTINYEVTCGMAARLARFYRN